MSASWLPVVVDLVALSVRAGAKKNTRVEGPVDFGLESQFEVLELPDCRKKATLARRLLHSDNSAVFDEPLAGQPVPGEIFVPLPAGQVVTVEKRNESVGIRPIRLIDDGTALRTAGRRSLIQC